MEKKHFYITTPIYYGTARPHLGSLYSTVIADVVARWQKLSGKDIFFMTGTDEHGQKIAQKAEQEGKNPKAFVDQFVPLYKRVWEQYAIAYTHFARTTDNNHIIGAQQFVKKLLDNGAIYKDMYEGWYCTPCEAFVAGKSAQAVDAPDCPDCHRTTKSVQEETYFFRLSAYKQQLLDLYRNNPHFITPKERLNEVIRFVESELHDLSISRTTVSWGVTFPDDAQHIIYVWVEALCVYLTSLGYGIDDQDRALHKWWPPAMQVIGKDIVRFHAVYWPALLMAADLSVPKTLLVHGWIKIDEEKMSKSRGNVIDPEVLAKEYGADEVRYFLMRYIPINQDGNFSIEHLRQAINADLANDLGNLLNRMISLSDRHHCTTLEKIELWSAKSIALRDDLFNTIADVKLHMDNSMFHHALSRVWQYINAVNAYFHAMEPWKLAKNDITKFKEVLSATAHSLRAIAYLLTPYMPQKMAELLASLGADALPEDNTIERLELGIWRQTFVLKKGDPLFKKHDIKTEKSADEVKADTNEENNYITIDDFASVELVIGTIVTAEIVEKSTKLLRLEVDFGPKGKRQIVSGVRQWYAPEDLLGKQALFVLNLKPRKMLGLESQGMMLFAKDRSEKQQFITVADNVPDGTLLG